MIEHRSGIKEFADADRVRTLPALTVRRLQLLRHSKCAACGEQATALVGGAMCCRLCGDIAMQRRKARTMGVKI